MEATAPSSLPTLAPDEGANDYQRLLDHGTSLSDVVGWQAQKEREQTVAGHDPKEVQAYWGQQDPDLFNIDRHVSLNLAAADQTKIAGNAKEYYAAGLGMTAAAMATQGLPKTKLGPDTPFWGKALAMAGQLTGDAPLMWAGAESGGGLGAGAGTLIGGPVGALVGGAFGAGFGAMALPAAARATYVDALMNGSIKSWDDF